MVLKSDVMNWVNDLRENAHLMLEDFIESVIIKDDSYNDNYKVNGVKDIYKEYLDDLFEADVIEVFWYQLKDILNGLETDVFEACKNKDYVKFIDHIAYMDEEAQFVNANIDRIGTIMNIIKNIRSNYPIAEEVNE